MSAASQRLEIPLLFPEAPGTPHDDALLRRSLNEFRQLVLLEPGVTDAEIALRSEQAFLIATVDSRLASVGSLERLAHRCGLGFAQRWATALLGVQGMVSRQSADAIESALAGLPHVRASASFPSRTVRIEFDRATCQLPEIAMRLGRMGFRVFPVVDGATVADGAAPPPHVESRPPPSHPGVALPSPVSLPAPPAPTALRQAWTWFRDASNNPLIEAIAGAVLLVAGQIVEWTGGPREASVTLYLLSYFAAGSGAARDTVISLARLRLNIDVLMFVAAIGAGLIGRLPEGALLLVLFAFGHAGETIALDKARKAIKALHDIAPETAILRDSLGATLLVPVDALRVGDHILVRPGDRIAADGVVIEGLSAVDQSPITGESIPGERAVGSRVLAGTLNGDGALTVEVERPHSESTLARAIRLVEEAQTSKSPSELLAARVERYYVPFVLAATVLLLLIPPLAQGGTSERFGVWFYRSMAFLTAASPCALAIGAPAAVLSALARAARMGSLIKGGSHLETLGKVRVVCFDKTGTLTLGRPRVVGTHPAPGVDDRQLLSLAASVEASSAHPLAHAVVEAAMGAGWDGVRAERVEQVVGRGLRGALNGSTIEIGSPAFFADDPGFAASRETIARCHTLGQTAIALRADGRFMGVIALADQPRPDAGKAITALRAMGVRRCVMLTGDERGPAEAVAKTLGIDEFHAAMLPEDKMRVLNELRAREGLVAMVGDGVNDAPALAAASVGIAVAAAGGLETDSAQKGGASDVALETADVALMHHDLLRLADTIALARFARRVIAQNVAIALGVILIMAPIAAMGKVPIGVAVIFHEGSTVVVVLNALRLLRFRPAARP